MWCSSLSSPLFFREGRECIPTGPGYGLQTVRSKTSSLECTLTIDMPAVQISKTTSRGQRFRTLQQCIKSIRGSRLSFFFILLSYSSRPVAVLNLILPSFLVIVNREHNFHDNLPFLCFLCILYVSSPREHIVALFNIFQYTASYVRTQHLFHIEAICKTRKTKKATSYASSCIYLTSEI